MPRANYANYTSQKERLNHEFAQGVAFGHVTAWLETFAERSEIPFALLANRVGRLLLSATDGEVLGPEHNLSTLRPNATDRNPTVEQVEMASGPRISGTSVKAKLKAKPRGRIGPGTYWTKMTPEERSAEMKRRMGVARNKMKLAAA